MFEEPFTPKPKKPKKVRETGRGGVEDTGRKSVARRGGRSLKWVSPGYAGVPDQIELYGVVAMIAAAQAYDLDLDFITAKALLAAAIQFTEYKAPGKMPTPHQAREHARLRAEGFTVNVVDQLAK